MCCTMREFKEYAWVGRVYFLRQTMFTMWRDMLSLWAIRIAQHVYTIWSSCWSICLHSKFNWHDAKSRSQAVLMFSKETCSFDHGCRYLSWFPLLLKNFINSAWSFNVLFRFHFILKDDFTWIKVRIRLNGTHVTR
jgi:hypothetical protein